MSARRRRLVLSPTLRRTTLPQKPARAAPLASAGIGRALSWQRLADPVLDQSPEVLRWGVLLPQSGQTRTVGGRFRSAGSLDV
jgi:hypothetical protein